MRVVYDTNVLVSAALKPGSTPAVLVALALTQRVHLCVSPSILAEYREVLHRPECALEARAAYLVTGNLRHFPVATFEDIHILEPARFAHVLAERLRL